MYTVTVTREFVAQHFLTVPDGGPENEWHSHRYAAEFECRGEELNEYGYLIDIDEINRALDERIDFYRDSTLNDLPEFEDLNPSVEHFARILCQELVDEISTDRLSSVTLRIWEDDHAWAAYELSVSSA
jgi:6-pyruvoyltetrahydropterin/6-carboxytetrahydropterin synthase